MGAQALTSRAPLRRMVYTGGAAGLFVALYAGAFLLPFPLLRWALVPKASFATIAGFNPLAAGGLALAELALLGLAGWMVRAARVRPGPALAALVIAGWLGASVALAFTFPGQSTDIGDYTFRAHMLIHLGRNPLTMPPSALIAWSQFPYLGWYHDVDAYGPLWHWLAGAVHGLAGESYLANLLGFKVLAILATGLSGALIYDAVRRLEAACALAALALWLWNPLVLNEGALNGHNDLVLVAVLVAGLWAVLRGWDLPGLLLVMAAGLIKANAWLLTPVVAVGLLRERGGRAALASVIVAGALGGGLILLAYAPFGGWVRLSELVRNRSWWPTATWTAALFFAVRDGLHWSHEWAVTYIVGAASALFAAVYALSLWRLRDLRVGAWAAVLAYLLIGAHWFQPWYATWLIALTALTAQPDLARYTWIFTGCMLLYPLAAQFFLGPLRLPPGVYDALMAALTLLGPQLLAIRLIPQLGRIGRGV